MADLVNAQLFYEAIARIISARTGTQITATVQKRAAVENALSDSLEKQEAE